MVQGEIINIIRQYIKNLKAGGIIIQFAYLYGSHARNEATPESDIDVLLIGDVFDTNDDVILSKPWLPKFRNDYRIEPIAIVQSVLKPMMFHQLLSWQNKKGLESYLKTNQNLKSIPNIKWVPACGK